MGMNDLWGTYYNRSLINNYWKEEKEVSKSIMLKQMIVKISFRGSFHTNKQRPELYVWDILHTNPDSHEGLEKDCIVRKLFLHFIHSLQEVA